MFLHWKLGLGVVPQFPVCLPVQIFCRRNEASKCPKPVTASDMLPHSEKTAEGHSSNLQHLNHNTGLNTSNKLSPYLKPNKNHIRTRTVFVKHLYLLSSCNWGLSDTFRRRHPIGWLRVCRVVIGQREHKTLVMGVILVHLSQDYNFIIHLLWFRFNYSVTSEIVFSWSQLHCAVILGWWLIQSHLCHVVSP